MGLDLLANPFAILGLTGDADIGTITARARELATAEAATASRSLMAPRTRLHAELSYLPGAPLELAAACVDSLKAGREPNLWPLKPLARSNVLAHLASQGMANSDQLRDLAGLQDVIPDTTGELIGAARERARMPPVPREMLDTAVETIAGQHAEAFTAGMLALPTGADLFTDQLLATAPGATARASFLRRSAAAWERATASDAAQDIENAASVEAILRERPHPQAAEQLATLVRRFATRTKPARQACRLVGLPHEVSAEVHRRWRSVALDLNNRQDAVREAVTVLEALVEGFGTTDELGVLTDRDLGICQERLASGEGTPEMRRLVAAIEAATKKRPDFQHCGMVGGRMTAKTPAAVAELHDAFVAATRAARSDLPWRLLREFTLRLHNEFSATAAALAFTQLAIEQGNGIAVASDTVGQLIFDLRNLRKERLKIELGAAALANKKSTSRRLLTQLVTLADDGKEWEDFQAALQKLNWQRAVTSLKYAVTAVCAITLYAYVTSNEGRPRASGSPVYSTSFGGQNQAASSGYIAPRPMAPVDPDAGRPERQPAPGTVVLARAELRWCRYQGTRVQGARDYLELSRSSPTLDVKRYNAGVDAFNGLVALLRGVCGSHKYREADGPVIDAELNQSVLTLKAEGQHLVASAVQAAVPLARSSSPQAPPTFNPAVDRRASDSALDPVRPPPAPIPTGFYPPPPSSAPTAADSLAYGEGQADRRDWESWISGQSGDFRAGAEWWAGVRSSARPPSCNRAPGLDRTTAIAGCSAARARLANVDRRRHSEPDYWYGWNSL